MRIGFLDFILLLAVLMTVTQVVIPFFCKIFGFKINYFWIFDTKKSVDDKIEAITELKTTVDSIKEEVKCEAASALEKAKVVKDRVDTL